MFDEVGPAGAVFLRSLFAAAILLPFARRISIREAGASDRRKLAAFGIALAGMNFCFYEALDRLPLGIAVTLEFVGPLTVALLGSRRPRDLVWALLAGAGILLLSGGSAARKSTRSGPPLRSWPALLGRLHPDQRPGRRDVPRPQRARLGDGPVDAARRALRSWRGRGRSDRSADPCRWPRGRAPLLGDSLRARAGGAAPPAERGLRCADEPRARGGGLGRPDRPRPGPSVDRSRRNLSRVVASAGALRSATGPAPRDA